MVQLLSSFTKGINALSLRWTCSPFASTCSNQCPCVWTPCFALLHAIWRDSCYPPSKSRFNAGCVLYFSFDIFPSRNPVRTWESLSIFPTLQPIKSFPLCVMIFHFCCALYTRFFFFKRMHNNRLVIFHFCCTYPLLNTYSRTKQTFSTILKMTVIY